MDASSNSPSGAARAADKRTIVFARIIVKVDGPTLEAEARVPTWVTVGIIIWFTFVGAAIALFGTKFGTSLSHRLILAFFAWAVGTVVASILMRKERLRMDMSLDRLEYQPRHPRMAIQKRLQDFPEPTVEWEPGYGLSAPWRLRFANSQSCLEMFIGQSRKNLERLREEIRSFREGWRSAV